METILTVFAFFYNWIIYLLSRCKFEGIEDFYWPKIKTDYEKLSREIVGSFFFFSFLIPSKVHLKHSMMAFSDPLWPGSVT